MEQFGKYVGVQGVLAGVLVVGWVVAPFVEVVLPEGYLQLMMLTLGFYFAKNGNNVYRAARGQ